MIPCIPLIQVPKASAILSCSVYSATLIPSLVSWLHSTTWIRSAKILNLGVERRMGGPLHTLALHLPSHLFLWPAFSASLYQKGPALFLTTTISPSPWGICVLLQLQRPTQPSTTSPGSCIPPTTLGAGPALAATTVVAAELRVVAQNRHPQANICLKQHPSSPRMSPPSCSKANQDTSAAKPQQPQQQPSAKA